MVATTRILLPNEMAVLPTSNPATKSTVTGAGTPLANTPAVTYTNLAFDAATDQTALWNFRLPGDYVSGGSVYLKWTCAATSGAVIWKAGVAGATDSSGRPATTLAFASLDVSATVTVPGTADMITETSWAVTATTLSAGRWVSLFVGRRAAAAGDTAAGVANILAAEFAYTS